MSNNVGIIITARIKSSRIQEKVLQQIGYRRAIEILLDNLNNTKYDVVLAIPQSTDCDILEQIGKERGVMVYRGEDDSPMHRLYSCAIINEFDHIVRITADDILIDMTLLYNQIQKHVYGNHDYTYMRRCPDGTAGEVIRVSALEKALSKIGDMPTEFVSYYMKDTGFDVFEYFPPKEYQFNYRLTMDWPEDLLLLRIIFASLKEPFGVLDIINFIKQHKYLLTINHLPAISVYTCNYNTSDYIARCMESIFSQSFSDFEYIVIDDHSTDNSMDVISEFYSGLSFENQNKMKVLRNEVNKGLPASSNHAIGIARGRFVVRVDSDDCIHQDYFSRVLDETRISDSQGCITGYERIGECDDKLNTVIENMWHPGCALISRWAANELKYKDNLKYMEGAEFFERFRKNYKMSFIPEPLWSYRIRPGQKTQDTEHPLNK